MKKYEQPTLDIICFEMTEALTSDVVVPMSGVPDIGEDTGEW